jgi:hypothetical protein
MSAFEQQIKLRLRSLREDGGASERNRYEDFCARHFHLT